MDNAVASTAHTAPFDWRDLYPQALFESERAHMHARIIEAERALLRRERELFAEPNSRAEREALTNALTHSSPYVVASGSTGRLPRHKPLAPKPTL